MYLIFFIFILKNSLYCIICKMRVFSTPHSISASRAHPTTSGQCQDSEFTSWTNFTHILSPPSSSPPLPPLLSSTSLSFSYPTLQPLRIPHNLLSSYIPPHIHTSTSFSHLSSNLIHALLTQVHHLLSRELITLHPSHLAFPHHTHPHHTPLGQFLTTLIAFISNNLHILSIAFIVYIRFHIRHMTYVWIRHTTYDATPPPRVLSQTGEGTHLTTHSLPHSFPLSLRISGVRQLSMLSYDDKSMTLKDGVVLLKEHIAAGGPKVLPMVYFRGKIALYPRLKSTLLGLTLLNILYD